MSEMHCHLVEGTPLGGHKRWSRLGSPHPDGACPLCADAIPMVLENPVFLTVDGRWFERGKDQA